MAALWKCVTPLTGDKIDPPAACAVPFRPCCGCCNANAKC